MTRGEMKVILYCSPLIPLPTTLILPLVVHSGVKHDNDTMSYLSVVNNATQIKYWNNTYVPHILLLCTKCHACYVLM